MSSKNQDYGVYHYSRAEVVKYVAQFVGISALIDYLFYKMLWLMLLAIPVSILYLKWKKKQLVQERKRRLNYQFRDALNSMSASVQAGYSVENAVSACVKDLEQLYGTEDDILQEFRYMEAQQKMSIPVEELFLDFGKRSGIEDIENLTRMLGDKIDVKKEIEATLAAKKSEQMIMSLMPAGIILYLQLASPGFLDMLYGNLFGWCAMTVCLAVYGGAYWMGKKIVDIEV